MRPAAGRAWPALRAVGALTLTAAMAGGVPYALAVYVGWPLPHRLPSWPGIRVFLTSPLTNDAIIKALACLTWLLWLAFTLSVILEAVAVARGGHAPRLPVIAPVQGFAAALVSAVILTSVPLPQPAPRPALHAVLAARTEAPPPDGPAPAAPVAMLAAAQGPGGSRYLAVPGHSPERPRVYRVVEGDNLWDIAARFLGDGEHWHQIYDLNRGKPQPGGGRLNDPDLIYPGWVLALPPRTGLPAGHHPPARSRPAPSPSSRPAEPDHDRRPGPRSGQEPGQHHHLPGHGTRTPRPAGHVPAHHRRERPAGVRLPGGGLVGITLAAAISAALVAWRLHRRRAFVPRWPSPDERAEPPLPEAISALRRAHLRSLAADAAEARGEPWPDDPEPGDMIPAPGGTGGDDEGLDEFGAPAGYWQPADPASGDGHPLAAHGTSAAGGTASGPLPAPIASPGLARPAGTSRGQPVGAVPPDEEYVPPAPPARPQPAGTVVFGTRGSAEIPLAAVVAGGLGLTGPGAHAAARALLIGVLAASAPAGGHAPARVIIPAAEFRQLTGDGYPPAARVPGVSPRLPDGLVITPDLAAALDRAETEITRRLRLLDAGDDSPAPLALIAPPHAASAPRIRAILDAGASAGITGILLGDWPSGVTCHIGAGGEVTEASDPGLAGIWASHLTPADTAAMLSMLRGAQGHLADEQPSPPEARPGRDAEGAAVPEPETATPEGPGGVGVGSQGAAGEGDPGDASPGARGPGPRSAGRSPRPGPAPAEPPRAMAAAQAGTVAGSAAPTASMVITASPPGTGKPVLISVLGRLRITARGQEISGGLRKARELLAYLAVHPQGVTGEGIGEALWPESSSRYAASQRHLAMRKAREMLRTATGLRAPMFIVLAAERYRLDPALIEVDLWQFDAALDRAREAASSQDQLAALRQAISLYQGPLSDGATYEWAERHAEPARRRAVDALARAADILQSEHPEQALTTLESALTHDPYNEALYQKIMDIQARLGRPDAARRTLALLESRLSAIGLAPSARTRHSP